MEEELANEKLRIIKSSLAEYLDIDKSFITISEPFHEAIGFKVEIEIKFEIPGENLRTFSLIVYTFSVNEINEEGFIYENQYYSFNHMNSFVKNISVEIEKME